MKSFRLAAGLLLATLPAMSIAQVTTSPPAIVVSGKHLKDWEKGSKLEAAGLKELEKARQDLVKASADVVNAQDKQASSQARSDNASAEFRRLTASTPLFADAGEALRWARQVEKAATSWDKFDDRKGEGAKDQQKSGKEREKAEKAVAKAQVKVDRARAQMADAERRSASSVQ